MMQALAKNIKGIVLVTVLICLLSEVGDCVTHLIDFEDLTATEGLDSVVPSPIAVIDHYCDQDILFPTNPLAINFSKGPHSLPGFAHSGSIALVQIWGGIPFEIIFIDPVSRIKVWAGVGEKAMIGDSLMMTAFDKERRIVGQYRTNKSALIEDYDSAHNIFPIRIPLEMRSKNINIYRVTINFAMSPTTYNLAIDDVEFDVPSPLNGFFGSERYLLK